MFAAETSSGVVDWLLADDLGSIRDVVQYNASTGNTDVIDHIVYDAFGNVVSQTDSANQPAFLFAGEMYDSNTGLYYDHERWYDPATGDFISQDPLGFAAGDSNLNRYVGNNVTSAIDPSGLQMIAVVPVFHAVVPVNRATDPSDGRHLESQSGDSVGTICSGSGSSGGSGALLEVSR